MEHATSLEIRRRYFIYYLYHHREDDFISLTSVSKFLGFSDDSSVKIRIKNSQACDDNDGEFEHYAQLNKASLL